MTRRDLHQGILPLLLAGQAAARGEGRRVSRDFGRFRRRARADDGPARAGPHDRSADLHSRAPCRRLRRPFRPHHSGQARRAVGGDMTRIALFQSTAGHRPGGQRAGADRSDRAKRRRAARRCCSRRKCRGCSTAIRRARRKVLRRQDDDEVLAAARGGGRAPDLGPSRLARGAGRGRQGRQPLLRHRPRRRGPRAPTTRSICSTSTCRPARAGANPTPIRPATERCSSTARRSASSA